MPVYSYHCNACGNDFDIRQSFDDSELDTCPQCGSVGNVRRVLTPAGVIFKGSGFYVTDNARSKNPASPASSNGKSGKDSGSSAAKSSDASSGESSTAKAAAD